MFDPNALESTPPVQSLPLEGPGIIAIIKRHRAFCILLATVGAQLLLLSVQITRANNVRLIRYWTAEALDPFERAFGGVGKGASTAYQTYRHLWHAEQENQELHTQLVAAQSQIQRLGQEAGENERLRRLLEFKQQLAVQTVAAEVMYSTMASTSSPGENSNAISIDKGSDAGLTSDLAVITPEGVVGKTLTVFAHSAQVLLLTDPTSGVGVTLSQSRVQGILKGGNDGFCSLQYVMNEEAVSRGEAVVTSGLDQVYPKDLPVGTVVTVGEGMIYKTISVKPAVDLNRLETVLVVLKPTGAEQQALNFSLHH
jgi:rod shape-determining protein MreC